MRQKEEQNQVHQPERQNFRSVRHLPGNGFTGVELWAHIIKNDLIKLLPNNDSKKPSKIEGLDEDTHRNMKECKPHAGKSVEALETLLSQAEVTHHFAVITSCDSFDSQVDELGFVLFFSPYRSGG